MAPAFEAFCAAVCRRVTYGPAHASITAELSSHLEDHAARLARRGLPQAEAESRAVAAMGDPEALGRALNRAHPVLLNLAEAAAELTVRFDLYGNTCTLRIPLNWGDLRDAPL